jgi:protein-S-isoprenylcysteine O-methyltransferase Ste14
VGKNKRARSSTPGAMKLGTLTMLLGSALPVLAVELAKFPPSTLIRCIALVVAVLGAVVVAHGHRTRPQYVGEEESRHGQAENSDGENGR